MNAESDTTSSDAGAIVTLEQMAAIDFEPIEGEPNLGSLPSNVDWACETMPTIRLAYLTLFKSKFELADQWLEDENLFQGLVTGIIDLQERLTSICDTLRTAETRLMCAYATATLKMEGAST